MNPDVKSVRYVGEYQIQLTFDDGVEGVADLSAFVIGKGGVFTSLEDKEYFAKVRINADIGTIIWPNDVDFDPEVLYSLVTQKPIDAISPPVVHSKAS